MNVWVSKMGKRGSLKALEFALSDEDTAADFIRIALVSHAVICCRCTPLQKVWVFDL